MSMLVTLDQMKSYLNVQNNDFDAFLTAQITVISDAIEGYCGRKFQEADYVQEFYSEDYDTPVARLPLYMFPVSEVASVVQDGVTIDAETYRLNSGAGFLVSRGGLLYGTKTVVSYTGGYADGEIPSPVTNAVYELVAGRYNKKVSGVDLNFGNDVQRISIPGALSIDFDYTLNNNERSSAFGVLLQDQVNVLDFYRSDRAVVGDGKLYYNTEAEA